MKLYIQIILSTLYLVLLLGYELPYLFSSSSDMNIARGIAYIVITPVILYYINRNLINRVMEKL